MDLDARYIIDPVLVWYTTPDIGFRVVHQSYSQPGMGHTICSHPSWCRVCGMYHYLTTEGNCTGNLAYILPGNVKDMSNYPEWRCNQDAQWQRSSLAEDSPADHCPPFYCAYWSSCPQEIQVFFFTTALVGLIVAICRLSRKGTLPHHPENKGIVWMQRLIRSLVGGVIVSWSSSHSCPFVMVMQLHMFVWM